MDQNSSSKIWYIVGAIVIIAFATWYFYEPRTPIDSTESTAVLSGGDTTADISADLDQITDDSSALDQDASASAEAVSGF